MLGHIDNFNGLSRIPVSLGCDVDSFEAVEAFALGVKSSGVGHGDAGGAVGGDDVRLVRLGGRGAMEAKNFNKAIRS